MKSLVAAFSVAGLLDTALLEALRIYFPEKPGGVSINVYRVSEDCQYVGGRTGAGAHTLSTSRYLEDPWMFMHFA